MWVFFKKNVIQKPRLCKNVQLHLNRKAWSGTLLSDTCTSVTYVDVVSTCFNLTMEIINLFSLKTPPKHRSDGPFLLMLLYFYLLLCVSENWQLETQQLVDECNKCTVYYTYFEWNFWWMLKRHTHFTFEFFTF